MKLIFDKELADTMSDLVDKKLAYTMSNFVKHFNVTPNHLNTPDLLSTTQEDDTADSSLPM